MARCTNRGINVTIADHAQAARQFLLISSEAYKNRPQIKIEPARDMGSIFKKRPDAAKISPGVFTYS